MEDVNPNLMEKVFSKKEVLWDPLLVMDKVDYKVKDPKVTDPLMENNKNKNKVMLIEDT